MFQKVVRKEAEKRWPGRVRPLSRRPSAYLSVSMLVSNLIFACA